MLLDWFLQPIVGQVLACAFVACLMMMLSLMALKYWVAPLLNKLDDTESKQGG